MRLAQEMTEAVETFRVESGLEAHREEVPSPLPATRAAPGAERLAHARPPRNALPTPNASAPKDEDWKEF
jgi:hypothetical protein